MALLVFGIRFEHEIGTFLENVIWFKLGPAEARRWGQPRPQPNPESRSEEPPRPQGEPGTNSPPTNNQEAGDDNNLEAVKMQADGWQQEAWRWWFEYLNVFLVPTTKFILLWLSQQQIPPTKLVYDETWKSTIPNPVERDAMLSALWHYQLVSKDVNALSVENSARRFMDYLDQRYPAWRTAVSQAVAERMRAATVPPPSISVPNSLFDFMPPVQK